VLLLMHCPADSEPNNNTSSSLKQQGHEQQGEEPGVADLGNMQGLGLKAELPMQFFFYFEP
jgi:hypothetical protein